MSKSNITIASKKETSILVRARFGPGMLLQHDDLEQLNSYPRELSRLMFRSLFGCGVICGLVVKTEEKCGKVYVIVGAGLALECSGDPIYVPKDQRFPIDESCDPDLPSPLWVVLCSTVKCCTPRSAMCASDDDEPTSVCTRERDGFEIRVVREKPKCTCGCLDDPDTSAHEAAAEEEAEEDPCKCADPELPCYADHYAGKCGCNCDDCSDCNCDCVLLARLEKNADDIWSVDHRVRRFIRPVLMRDPQVEIEQLKKATPPPTTPTPDPAVLLSKAKNHSPAGAAATPTEAAAPAAPDAGGIVAGAAGTPAPAIKKATKKHIG
jgi:hypothetical protein